MAGIREDILLGVMHIFEQLGLQTRSRSRPGWLRGRAEIPHWYLLIWLRDCTGPKPVGD